MPKFLTIGYGDEKGYERTAPQVRNEAHAQDSKLRKRGTVLGMAGDPVQVRNPDAKNVSVTKGAFLSSPLPIAGFAIIEAADLSEAIEMVSGVPCAVCHGVVEVWPLKESK